MKPNRRNPLPNRSGVYKLPSTSPAMRQYNLTMRIRCEYTEQAWTRYISASADRDDPFEVKKAKTICVLNHCHDLITLGQFTKGEVYDVVRNEVRNNVFVPDTKILSVASQNRFEASIRVAMRLTDKLCKERHQVLMASITSNQFGETKIEASASGTQGDRYFTIARAIYAAFYQVKKWRPHAGQLKLDIPRGDSECRSDEPKLKVITRAKMDALVYTAIRLVKKKPDTFSTTLKIIETFLTKKNFTAEIPRVWVAIYDLYYGDRPPSIDEFGIPERFAKGNGVGTYDATCSQLTIEW